MSKPLIRSLSLCSLIAAALLVGVWMGRTSDAAKPDPPMLKTQVLNFEDVQPHVADWGEMRRYFGGQTLGTKDVYVAVGVIEPGKSVHRSHRHQAEEYLAIVEGDGTWTVGDKKQPARVGDILYTEPWVYHGLTNSGEKKLVFLVVKYSGRGVELPPQPDDRPNEIDD